jgi:hypothetical protein
VIAPAADKAPGINKALLQIIRDQVYHNSERLFYRRDAEGAEKIKIFTAKTPRSQRTTQRKYSM